MEGSTHLLVTLVILGWFWGWWVGLGWGWGCGGGRGTLLTERSNARAPSRLPRLARSYSL